MVFTYDLTVCRLEELIEIKFKVEFRLQEFN